MDLGKACDGQELVEERTRGQTALACQDQTQEETGFRSGEGRKSLEYCHWKSPSDANRHRRGEIKTRVPRVTGPSTEQRREGIKERGQSPETSTEAIISNY